MLSAFLLLGYLCGSVPFGVLLTRWVRGVDVRASGSGNIGATNVTRVAGKKLGAVVLLLDALKAVLPVALAVYWMPGDARAHVLVGLAAVLGHVYPVWLKLQGGKGVASALGVLVVLVPEAALAGAIIYGLVVARWRVSSVGSLSAAVVAIVTAFLTAHAREYVLLTAGLFVLMLWTHRSNLQRLARRTEHRL
ncbi:MULTISPECIES: glycerol-3-phosphate 1-O-acyltransferase PlsY [Corallococcus]|uniref:glycerol-3-phosphate 1-O-acyltransferase PlsY n=1 Tax=Corallococcus TaxID=83461 RepID=UPI00118052AE|nr:MULTISPECIES: glycerol-3-phosphate 1-O-acyltransferase PlsY [Corallococcus]NBD07867.1 glycerol-3-phosphate acyltransferase [Corallococcus silvisoli]TSC33849.1 glycerol-3-phosphate acyltransferase [Corallococcus sp. Z5C101001]